MDSSIQRSESEYNDCVNLVEEFSRAERSISLDEIAISLIDPAAVAKVLAMLSKDNRFYIIGEKEVLSKVQFLPKRAFIRRLWHLNVRVWELGLKEIPFNMFASTISPLFSKPLDVRDQLRLVGWSTNYSLAVETKQGSISFPNGDLINRINTLSRDDLPNMLCDIIRSEPDQNALKKMIEEYLNMCLKKTVVNARNLKIILMRFGLEDGSLYTLDAIGEKVGLTKEGVRLVERSFWSKLTKDLKEESIIESLLCIISYGRKVFVESNNIFLNRIKLICWAGQIALPASERLKICLLGAKVGVIKQIESLVKNPRCINVEYGLLQLDEIKGLSLTEVDKKAIASIISKNVRRNIDLTEIVELGFERIGRPAHYSEITHVCSEIFPERRLTPKNVHAVLCRNPSLQSKALPWVWTGSRGVFALKEWGYKRPKLGLYDAVFEIVKKRYVKTGNPVAFAVIRAEIGKYRQIIKESSLIFACYCNNKITAVGKDRFVPSVRDRRAKREVNQIDKLDKRLRFLDRLRT